MVKAGNIAYAIRSKWNPWMVSGHPLTGHYLYFSTSPTPHTFYPLMSLGFVFLHLEQLQRHLPLNAGNANVGQIGGKIGIDRILSTCTHFFSMLQHCGNTRPSIGQRWKARRLFPTPCAKFSRDPRLECRFISQYIKESAPIVARSR